MAITFNDTSTGQGIVQDLRFTSGQDALSINDATRLLNFALDRYSHLAITASGRWKWDDSTNADRPKATATLTEGTATYKLDAEHLVIDEVEVYYDGVWCRVEPIDASRDNGGTSLAKQYIENGKPEYYDMQGRFMTLYATPDADATHIRVWFSRAASHFAVTDTTSTIGIPSIHQDYLPLWAAYRLALRTGDKTMNHIDEAVKRKEREIVEFFGIREMNTPQTLVGNVTVPE